MRRRAWSELAYVLVGMPLAVLGAAYVLICLLLGAALAVTALGVPLLAAAVPATRMLGRARLALAGALLGEHVPAPEPYRRGGGLFAGLRDGPGWRAVAYQVVALPLAVVSLAVATATWGWGLVALTAPIQRAFGVNVPGSLGPAGIAALCASGAVLLLLAPRAVRATVLLDRLLIRALLARDERASRIEALERTRAGAVEGAAATLRRIERDLHDGVQARLVALAMHLTIAAETLPADGRPMLLAARNDARDAIRELREVIQGIHPPILDNGLDAAVATLAARSPVPVTHRVALATRPTAAIETIAYFTLAELLTNVARHSRATEAAVEVTEPDAGALRLVVRDNGAGGAPPDGGATPNGGTGLRGIADRVAAVDGTLAVTSPPGGPTVVTVDLPRPR
ncbi:sensor domain-containing protein [Dactylosporangium sp. NPDC049140]|uniref:sensor histidine kinase n=1 Tax=Dactylosporangium sp. NPDC049140 TaxID=3155647 RepID=UPI0033CEAD2B